jgi:hypothetical protein
VFFKREKKLPHKFSYLLIEMKQSIQFPNYISVVLGWLNLLIIYNDDLRERMNSRAELTGKNHIH